MTRVKRKEQRTGFRQSGCDRSTILTRARFQVGVSIIRAGETVAEVKRWHDRHRAPTRQLRSSFQSPVTRVKRTRRRDALGIDARTIFAVLPVRPVQPAPTHPSPSARQFRLLLNDLANICAETDVLQRGRCVRARTSGSLERQRHRASATSRPDKPTGAGGTRNAHPFGVPVKSTSPAAIWRRSTTQGSFQEA